MLADRHLRRPRKVPGLDFSPRPLSPWDLTRQFVVWSPDGRAMAYRSTPKLDGPRPLVVVLLATGAARPVITAAPHTVEAWAWWPGRQANVAHAPAMLARPAEAC